MNDVLNRVTHPNFTIIYDLFYDGIFLRPVEVLRLPSLSLEFNYSNDYDPEYDCCYLEYFAKCYNSKRFEHLRVSDLPTPDISLFTFRNPRFLSL